MWIASHEVEVERVAVQADRRAVKCGLPFPPRDRLQHGIQPHGTFEILVRERSAAQVRQALRGRGVTHVYVDWFELERYRSPGNYGFTPFVTPEVFARLVDAGVLAPPESLGKRPDLYGVRRKRGRAWMR